MKYLKPFCFSLLALVLALIDTSFFSFISIYGATIISVFVVAIFLALVSSYKNNLYYVFASVLAMAIFSSLPIPLIFLLFVILPVVILYLRNIFIKDVSVWLAILVFVVTSTITFLFLVVYMSAFSADMFLMGAYFIVLNSILGLFIFLVYKRLGINFVRGEVKFR